jgi:uncharacterized membrane protein
MAIAFVLPVLVVVFALMIRDNKMAPKAWLIVVGLQLAATVMGYVSLETGETEEHTVAKVVAKRLIHAHEEAAEIFVASLVIGLVLGIAAFFLRRDLQFKLQLAIAGVALISCYLGFETGRLGGELVYRHNAASAYHLKDTPEAGSVVPRKLPARAGEESESTKVDETDYEPELVDEEDFRPEK